MYLFNFQGNMKQHLLTHKIKSSESSVESVISSSISKNTPPSPNTLTSTVPISPNVSSIFTSAPSNISPVVASFPFTTTTPTDISVPLRASMAPFYSSINATSQPMSVSNNFPPELEGRFSQILKSPMMDLGAESKNNKSDMANLKRERDGEIHLPLSKRSQSEFNISIVMLLL